ncbi:unnamed protein product [Calypogeia fissa]
MSVPGGHLNGTMAWELKYQLWVEERMKGGTKQNSAAVEKRPSSKPQRPARGGRKLDSTAVKKKPSSKPQ